MQIYSGPTHDERPGQLLRRNLRVTEDDRHHSFLEAYLTALTHIRSKELHSVFFGGSGYFTQSATEAPRSAACAGMCAKGEPGARYRCHVVASSSPNFARAFGCTRSNRLIPKKHCPYSNRKGRGQ
ncbi:hypothetical protein HPB52_025171 [Rhipicephalus sanguineus]|uniref:Uncharacterized protein n=1 Tax=Rhipicephalus sanguineus TaxID=34632 RepID=A0A9D4TDF9_RHISA|nr:hypothetical protein HPB52_025171 [Rhipicephalus sanguineus]